MTAKFVLQKHGQDRYLILFQTHNGQILLTSEVRYKDVALNRILSTRSLARSRKNYQLHTSQEGWFYFSIKDGKGEVLALSDMYPDEESMLKGINLVKGNARGSQLEDLTLPPPPFKFRKAKKA